LARIALNAGIRVFDSISAGSNIILKDEIANLKFAIIYRIHLVRD
jgi:hypothetical protein